MVKSLNIIPDLHLTSFCGLIWIRKTAPVSGAVLVNPPDMLFMDIIFPDLLIYSSIKMMTQCPPSPFRLPVSDIVLDRVHNAAAGFVT